MNKRSSERTLILEEEPESLFWDSQVYRKLDFKNLKKKSFRYYDDTSFLKYIFFHWVNKWAFVLSKKYVEPYKYHPLPYSDQIFKWYPTFSKHVSDGIVRLDCYHYAKSQSKDTKAKKPYKSILLRALVLTVWKRTLFLILGLIVVNVLSMSTAVLVKKILMVLNDKSFNFIKTTMLLLSIVVFQIIDGLLIENVNFHIWRLVSISHYLFAINPFHQGMCNRRKFANNIEGINSLNVCNEVLHSCSPDSQCSKNPLFCQALRYQNKEINSQMFSFTTVDSYNISFVFFPIKQIMEFLSNFCYGIYLLSLQVKVNIWLLYFVGIFFIFLMIVIEIISVFVFRILLHLRDYRLSKSEYIINSLSLITTMLHDDIAINIITQSRNNELYMVYFDMFLTIFNYGLFIICVNGSFYIIKQYFVESVNSASVITDIDTAGFMAIFYIFQRIINSMVLIPMSIHSFRVSYVSFKRLEKFIKDCSPNFYITGNPYTGSTKTATVIADTTNQIPNDVVVYFKDASFTWVNTRDDLLNKNYDIFLKDVNFVLKRGEMAVVTGSKGAGKSNFIKTMLGEMTLVGGSMAVVPLHTSMPIFYASQDIFLQQGTIRSNIVFGYKFDEQLYNTVLKAVELELDISTWDKGDLRVVSDNAHSLSGGQRVRMEMARAVYAYLVFHKVNKQYNNSKCSFLMCLDASFHGLDPYVSKNIFNNLFNLKTGLLSKNDLSVVLTSSKQTLEICSRLPYLGEVPNPPIYNVKNNKLKFHSYLHDFIKVNKPVNNEDYKYFSTKTTGPCEMNYLTADMLSLCSSDATTRLGRMEMTRSKYSKSFKSYAKDELAGSKYNPYFVYIKPAIPLFVLYMILTVVMTIMDNVKLVLSTNLSDYITKNINQYKKGQFVDLSEIKTRSNLSFKITIIFVSVIIVLSIFSSKLLALSCFTSSLKIHEYSINSLFKNSSSVIKVKKEISQVITFLSCDVFIFDSSTAAFLSGLLYLLVQLLANIITLLLLIPISIPFVLLIIIISLKNILLKITKSSKNSHYGYLEALVHLNCSSENAIIGSSIFRTFIKQPELVDTFIENRDYAARCKFYSRFAIVWSTITFNWVFSLTTLLTLIALIALDKYTKYKLKVGYFGLALSFSMSIIKLYSKFSILYTALEMFTCSVVRFRYFIPPDRKLKFNKCVNIHQEYLINPNKKAKLDKNKLLKRRLIEFKTENKKYYWLRRLFYHPTITIFDVYNYITTNHTGVELNDICVYTTPDLDPESMILTHLTVSAHRSEIIGIIGRTGAGKTTLLSVLQNIIENRTGQVMLDGKDLNDIPKVVLRQIIGVLPQLPFVFKGWTVRRFLDPRRLFSDADINDALNKCGLLNFVNGLPGGMKLDTVLVQEDVSSIYEQCDNKANEEKINTESNKLGFISDMIISNSQIRTLNLARLVLYKDFYRMIVVDEPPQEDLAEEKRAKSDDQGIEIYNLLRKYFGHCTTFVTAHDVKVLKTCTSVWVIHEGSLVKTCKASDIAANESIASIIEECVKYS